MEKILIYSPDSKSNEIIKSIFLDDNDLKKYGIIGFINNDVKTLFGYKCFSINECITINPDKIVIIKSDYSTYSIINNLVYGYGFNKNIFRDESYLVRLRLLEKYKDSKDKTIQKTMLNISNNENFDMYCGYCPEPGKIYRVYWDKEYDMPYIIYCGKKMYYPRQHPIGIYNDGKQYLTAGLEFEQQEGSPHRYTMEYHDIPENGIVVDAGVCEGNFALKYIDKVSKIYLIECDYKWIYPLQLTFKDYKDKVVLCTKALSDKDDDSCITLDTLVGDNRVDFIKMDIEGYEPSALIGAKKVFTNNDIICSICSYHRHGDEKRIIEILSSYGYKTSFSNGHMCFNYEDDWLKWTELRHGLVYAQSERIFMRNKLKREALIEDKYNYMKKIFSEYITTRIEFMMKVSDKYTQNIAFKITDISDITVSCNELVYNGSDNIRVNYIESSAMQLNFNIMFINNGEIDIVFRGIDVKESNGNENIPYWIDYTSILVNGEEKLKQRTPIWYGSPITIKSDVTSGQVINFSVKWLPHIDERVNR